MIKITTHDVKFNASIAYLAIIVYFYARNVVNSNTRYDY